VEALLNETHIRVEEGQKPRIAGRRITVQHIATFYEIHRWNIQDIAEQFKLTLSQVHAALAYYYDHKSEIDQAREEEHELAKTLPRLDDVLDGTLKLVMTPKEVAEEYPIQESTVYQAINRGRLAARKSGGSWLILAQDAEALWGHKRNSQG
jgi:excisionase family DNA binding protein